jgi:putative FmdB family regulatory protein
MPFYEYECSNCKFYSEVMQKITDAPMTKCPSCGKKALKKLISAPNFRLKGGGWYETDFKGDKENKRNLAGADKEESSKSETTAASAESSKTEAASKPEASKPETSKPETSSKTDSGKADASSKGASASGSGSSAEPKSSATRRSSAAGGRSAKPAVRTVATKARPVAASRSKPKPKPPARKKARR